MRDRTAFGMNFEEFCKLHTRFNDCAKPCYSRHQICDRDESFMDFLKRGSESLKKNPKICNKLY